MPAQGDNITLLRPLLLREVDQRQDVAFHLVEVQAQVAVEESSRHEAETLGLTRSLQVDAERVVHAMTVRTRVLIQLVGLTNLLREEINENMHTDQIRYAINFKVQGPAHMAMRANFSTQDSLKRQLLPQSLLQRLLRVLNLTTILLQSNGKY